VWLGKSEQTLGEFEEKYHSELFLVGGGRGKNHRKGFRGKKKTSNVGRKAQNHVADEAVRGNLWAARGGGLQSESILSQRKATRKKKNKFRRRRGEWGYGYGDQQKVRTFRVGGVIGIILEGRRSRLFTALLYSNGGHTLCGIAVSFPEECSDLMGRSSEKKKGEGESKPEGGGGLRYINFGGGEREFTQSERGATQTHSKLNKNELIIYSLNGVMGGPAKTNCQW